MIRLGDMLMLGNYPPKLLKALAVIAETIHPASLPRAATRLISASWSATPPGTSFAWSGSTRACDRFRA